MKIQIVYCGFSDAAYLSAVKIGGDEVYLIHSNEERSLKVKDKIKEVLSSKEHVVSPYDISENYRVIHEIFSNIIKKNLENNVEIYFNVTGATKYGLLATFTFAQYLYLQNELKKPAGNYLAKTKFVYLEESTGKISEMPLIFFFYVNEIFTKLSEVQKIRFKGKKPYLQRLLLEEFKNSEKVYLKYLEQKLNKSKTTITLALKGFIKAGLIAQKKDKTQVYYEVNKKAIELIIALERIYPGSEVRNKK